MSWFEAANLKNFARSAIKEAQKTLDKALDIQEESNSSGNVTPIAKPPALAENLSFKISDVLAAVTVEPGREMKNTNSSEMMDDSSSSTIMDEIDLKTRSSDEKEQADRSIIHEEAEFSMTAELEECTRMRTNSEHSDEKKSEISSSSKSAYDVVRLDSVPYINGSDATSIDDEFETTTSSDIEFIGSPFLIQPHNTHHPTNITLKKVESSVGSDDLSEVTRLVRKLNELNDNLDAREQKVIELSRNNAELVEKNNDLFSQTQEMKKHYAIMNGRLNSLTESLSSLETKLQQKMTENEALKTTNQFLLVSSNERVCVAEKDQIIADLRLEGEQLSKEVGKYSEIIKKLRTKEKTCDKEIIKLKTQLDDRVSEIERLQKSLGAKNEIEVIQIEAIQGLTSSNEKWERENLCLASELEDAKARVNSLITSVEAANLEISNLKELIKKGENDSAYKIQSEIDIVQGERNLLMSQLDELRSTLLSERTEAEQRELILRRERTELQSKIFRLEDGALDASVELALVTSPLMQQVGSLRSELATVSLSEEKLTSTLVFLKEEVTDLRTKQKVLYERLEEKEALVNRLESSLVGLEGDLTMAKSRSTSLSESLEKEQQQVLLERQKVSELILLKEEAVEALSRVSTHVNTNCVGCQCDIQENQTILETSSVDESSVLVKKMEFDYGMDSHLTDCPSVSVPSDSSAVETLQSKLKFKQGIIIQLETQVALQRSTCESLSLEVLILQEKLEKAEIIEAEAKELSARYQETQLKHELMLTMYGEVKERNEELRMDLEDLKEHLKLQTEVLLSQNNKKSHGGILN